MNKRTKLRTWKVFSPLLITLLLIGPLVSMAETAVNFPVTNNGSFTLPANSPESLVMQFDLPIPGSDTMVHDGAGFAVNAGDLLLSLVGSNFKFGDVTHGNNNNSYSGAEIIVDSADNSVTTAEVVTPGLANLLSNWNVGQNIYFGDEDHDNGGDYSGNSSDVIIVNSADNNIDSSEVVHAGLADLNNFPASYLYLETDASASFNAGEDIIKIAHDGAIPTVAGDKIQLFGANDYFSDGDVSSDYTDGELIVSSADGVLDNTDTVVTAGSLNNTFNFGATVAYDSTQGATPDYCLFNDIGGLPGVVDTGDTLIYDDCGLGLGDGHLMACAGDAGCGHTLVAMPNHHFIDDNVNASYDSGELIWNDTNTNSVLDAGEFWQGASTTALTSLSGLTSQFFNDGPAGNGVCDDGEDIYNLYYAGTTIDIATGDSIRTFAATEKFSDENAAILDGDYTVSGVTGTTELIANSADNVLSPAEIVTPGLVDVTHMWVVTEQVYSDANGDNLFTDGELIANSADTILSGGEINLDGNIDLIGFGINFGYHDGSGDTNYTDGEDIVSDDDGSGFYDGDVLTNLTIDNAGTCTGAEITSLNIYEDNGDDTFVGGDTLIGTAATYGASINVSATSQVYTASSTNRTLLATITTAGPAATICTFEPIIPNNGGAPYAALFISGDNGPTDADVTTTDVITIDLEAPTPTVGNITTTITDIAGDGAVVNATDTVNVVWDAALDGYTDVASVSADFTDFGGGVVAMRDDGAGCDTIAADRNWCADYTVGAGTIDDTDNDVSITLTTDTAGNVASDVTDDTQFSVDNETPTVTTANISVTGDSGTGGTFIYVDSPIVRWDSTPGGDNNNDIASVTFDASAFLAGDTTLSAGNLFDYWTTGLSGAMTTQESNNNNVTVTVVDDGGNTVILAGTNNYSIDTVVPTPNPANITTTITEHAGSALVVNDGDDVSVEWDSSAYGDVASVSADFSDFGGGVVAMEDDGAGGSCPDGAAADGVWCATYLTTAGIIDDTDNDVTITLATDAAGNIAADVDDDIQFSVDNQAPVLTAGNIRVTGDSGTAGAFKAGDTAVPTWDNSALGDNNSDIASVTIDGSSFRAADAAMPAADDGNLCDLVALDGIWCSTFTGLLDSQDDINNNVTLTVVDDGGNTTVLAGTNDYIVDNELPGFTVANSVEALMQSGAAPTLSTNLWYYYTGQNLRILLSNATETDGNDLAVVKACMRSMNEHSPTQTCAPGDFTNPANYQLMTVNVGADNAELNYDLAGLPSGWPTQVDGFQMNFELTDDVGNIWASAAPAQYYVAVFNVIPQNIVAALNNATTTDWSTITDFTNVPAGTIVFNAQDAGFVDIARMTFNAAMNLTDQATVTGLQAFAANITTTDSVLRLDSAALAAFDIDAQLMLKPAGGAQPEITVHDNAGGLLGTISATAGPLDSYSFGGHGTASNFVWAAGPGTLTFDVTGFSSYESDVTAPTATIAPATGASGVLIGTNVVVTFDEAMDTGTFTYTLAPNPGGLGVVWSVGDTVATISHTAFANSTSYTFSITGGDDLSGNSIVPTASTFTTAAASGGGGGGGGGGSAAFGAPACSGTACTSKTIDTTEDLIGEDTADDSGDSTFSDVVDHWGASFIEVARSQGYIDGYEDNTFRPDQNINRAEAAKLIAMWMKPDLAECTESSFQDVSCTEWFAKYVMYLKLTGVIEGYTDGTFRPEAVITRAEALKMMLYAKGITNPDVSGVENIFSDVGSKDWFFAPVLKGYSMGIITGYEDGTFKPNKPITRAEFTKIFVTTLLAVG